MVSKLFTQAEKNACLNLKTTKVSPTETHNKSWHGMTKAVLFEAGPMIEIPVKRKDREEIAEER